MKKILFLSLICILFGCSESTNKPKETGFSQPFKSMLVYPKKNMISEFSLFQHNQEVFNNDNFKGRWNLIFIGYTNCPDVCPATLTDITRIYNKIDEKLQKRFQVILLSVDPERDNLKHLAQYLDYFHEDFLGVTGNKPDIDQLVASLGGIYALNKEEGEFYSVDHSARIFIVNPKGERFGIISSESMHNKDKSLLISELNQLAELN